MNISAYALGVMHQPREETRSWPVDYTLLGTVVLLLCIGLVMVGSSSVSIAEQQYGSPFFYMWRQAMYIAVGVVAMLVIVRIPLAVWKQAGPFLIILSLLFLMIVFIPGIGRTVNGSTRWLAMGSFSLQPSEFVKLFTLVYLAGYLVRHHVAVQTSTGGFIRPLILMMLLVTLLLLEPDYGAAAVLLATAMGMMWLAGVRIPQFILLIISAASVLALLAYVSPERMERLTSFRDPWAEQFAGGFQLTQALIAFGRGEWFGVGLGGSVQKLFYLPEAHTDFLFAVLAEELGLFGVLVVIGLFTLFVVRSLVIARRAELRERPYAAYLSYGIGLWIGLQVVVNLGVNMGILPTKGLTLPFMSYGGSSLLVMMMAVAILLRVDYETRKDDRVVQKGRRSGA
ncbi:MAG: putative lipid II flippase FtsW [Gammaproteobacteria bacterium]|nr:putative lipid II flippase FtsW [Gammaproteobacteria bacterium]MDH5651521.1 putative lipid II flippase FtsW [Gammaproteobacteria bacterium]